MLFLSDLGVVIKKIPAGEKNEVVILLTREHGKMAFMAYGSRDPKSRKGGNLQLFNTIDFQARASRLHMPAMKEVRVISSRAGKIVDQDEKLCAYFRACEIVKLVNDLTKDLQGGGKGFDDLESALDQVKAPGITLIFWIRLLTDFGFLPDFRTCTHCHVKINLQDSIQFSTENRGFAHQRCLPVRSGKIAAQEGCQERADKGGEIIGEIDNSVLKAMVYFQSVSLDEAVKVKLDAGMMKKMKEIMEQIIL